MTLFSYKFPYHTTTFFILFRVVLKKESYQQIRSPVTQATS